MKITLENIKNRDINYKLKSQLKFTFELYDKHNEEIHRHRMDSKQKYWINSEIWDMCHKGNDPMENSYMLDRAKLIYDLGRYTEKEWNKYFLPAINKMIDYNNTFERWHPGYLIKDVKGNLAIVEHDYSEAFGGRDYTSLAIYELDSNENITYGWAWAKYENYCLVSKEPEIVSKNLEKIRKHNIECGNGAPIGTNPELAKKLGYASIHTYESAKVAGWEPKEGAIKL